MVGAGYSVGGAGPELRVDEVAGPDWDGFVAQHRQGHLLQQRAWAELKAVTGQQARRIVVLAPDGRPVAGAQVLLQRRYGLSVAYVPRGPLWAGEAGVDGWLLQALERLARRQRAVFLRIEPNLLEDLPGTDEKHTWLLLQGWQPARPMQPRSSVHLALDQPTEQLFAGFSKGHRADIRRAERQGVAVRVGTGADLATFYALMQATASRAAFGIHTAEYYQAAWRFFGAHCRLLLAEIGGQVVAAHMVFSDGRRTCYLYGGADASGLKSGANHLLQWYAVQWAQERGCRSYDFWGIPDALGQAATCDDAVQRAQLETAAHGDPLIGVYRFKKGFGGKIVRYLPAYDRVFMPVFYRLWQQK